MSLIASTEIKVQSVHTSALDYSTARDEATINPKQAFTAGTGNKQVDVVFHDKRTLTTGSNEDIDLAGSLSDAFGQTITFAAVKAIMISNLSTARILTVTCPGSNGWSTWVVAASDGIKIPPEGQFFLSAPNAGFTVTATTGDLLNIANDAGSSCDYAIWITGTST